MAASEDSLAPALSTHGARTTGFDLARAIRSAADGAVVSVPPGEWRLSTPLRLTRSVALVGDGPERCRVVCSAGGVLVISSGEVRLAGLALVYDGTGRADVVACEAGLTTFEQCRIEGAREGRAFGVGPLSGGAGVRVTGRARVGLTGCVLSHHMAAGLAATDEALVALVDGEVRQNGGSGLLFERNAGGEVRGTLCVDNRLDGVTLGATGRWALMGVVCRANQRDGLRVVRGTKLVADELEARGNREAGVRVAGRSQATFRQGHWHENQGCGLLADVRARVELHTVVAGYNGASGFAWSKWAKGRAVNCFATHNGAHGVLVAGRSEVELDEGQVRHNQGCGVCACHGGQVRVADVWSVSNRGDGLRVQDAAWASLGFSQIAENGSYGVYVGEDASASLAGNAVQANTFGDVYEEEGAEVETFAGEEAEDPGSPAAGTWPSCLPSSLRIELARDLEALAEGLAAVVAEAIVVLPDGQMLGVQVAVATGLSLGHGSYRICRADEVLLSGQAYAQRCFAWLSQDGPPTPLTGVPGFRHGEPRPGLWIVPEDVPGARAAGYDVVAPVNLILAALRSVI